MSFIRLGELKNREANPLTPDFTSFAFAQITDARVVHRRATESPFMHSSPSTRRARRA